MAAFHSFLGFLLMPTFAERLKAAREARNLNQSRLSEQLGVNPKVYNRWEKGTAIPHFDTVVKIADLLQVSLDQLAGRTDLTDARFRNPKLERLYREAETLPDEDQQALMIVLDSLVKRSHLTKLLEQ